MIETIPIQSGCRYFLRQGARTSFDRGFRSKAEVDAWLAERIEEKGLDWRVGYTVKLRGDEREFEIVNRYGVGLRRGRMR